jgi:TRAP transporter TAXI family solute receptor
MRKSLLTMAICLVFLLTMGPVFAGGQGDTGGMEQTYELSIGTAGMGGAYYPMGQAVATVVSNHVDNVSMVPAVTGGSVANNRLVANHEQDIGITNANLAYFAVNGTNQYEGTKLQISAIMAIHPSLLHIYTLAGSPINSLRDIKGKRVAAGTAGGGTITFIELLLPEYNMSIDDITPSFLSYADGSSQLGDGNVDIAFVLAGYPASAVTQLQASHKIKFIELEPNVLDSMLKKYPYYTTIVVPKEIYKTSKPVTAIGVRNLLVVNNDMDEELVYNITKALNENIAELREITAIANNIDPDKVTDVPIALHPGAKRYYDEVGK